LDAHKGTKTIERKPTKAESDLEIPFKMNGENHTLYFRNGKLFMASKFGDFITKLNETTNALQSAELASADVDRLLVLAKTIIKKGKSKRDKNKPDSQHNILEMAEELIQELQDIDVSDQTIKEEIGILDDLSKEAVQEVDQKRQTALDQKVVSFVSSTNYISDNNALGKALVGSSNSLSWVGSSGSTNHISISRFVISKIEATFTSSDTQNRRLRGPKVKRGGKEQINLEIKPEGTTWDNYDRRSPYFLDDFTGYCNYHINII